MWFLACLLSGLWILPRWGYRLCHRPLFLTSLTPDAAAPAARPPPPPPPIIFVDVNLVGLRARHALHAGSLTPGIHWLDNETRQPVAPNHCLINLCFVSCLFVWAYLCWVFCGLSEKWLVVVMLVCDALPVCVLRACLLFWCGVSVCLLASALRAWVAVLCFLWALLCFFALCRGCVF